MSFIWIGATLILFNYVAAEIIVPKLKWYILSFLVVLAIVWEIFLFLDPLASISIYEPLGENTDLIDEDLISGSPLYLMANLIILIGIFLLTPGYLFKSIKATSVIRKKYLYLAIGNFLIPFFAIFEGFGAVGVSLFFIRVGFIANFWLFYFGLREEPIKIAGITENGVKVEDSIFRIRERPAQITEEEVTYYKEQKICLVCKGKLGGFNNYICTGCDVLYCEKCARALTNIDNVCWVCDEPIDKSKPVKPIFVEGAEEGEKRPGTEPSESLK
jgi:hypothetical protein